MQPLGQHPSPETQEMIEVKRQVAEQVVAAPTSASEVQVLLSEHDVGQLDGGSHVSVPSMTRLPQPVQSPSLRPVHPPGQQPSPD